MLQLLCKASTLDLNTSRITYAGLDKTYLPKNFITTFPKTKTLEKREYEVE